MSSLAWLAFFVVYFALLIADLGVFSRGSKIISIRQALARMVLTIAVALSFGGLIYFGHEHSWLQLTNSGVALTGREALVQYVTGYLLEWSLSVDNIFVIAIIFSYMKVPQQYQYRVLLWGIIGAIILRGIMIGAGAVLIHLFDWTFYLFGAILIFSAARMLWGEEAAYEPDKSVLVRIARRAYPVTDRFDGDRFFTLVNGRRAATPLFVTLLFVDFADVVFAVDSIPAIFAVTQNSFLVFTSNAFAILGLRSLYVAIASLMGLFKYLKISLVFVLAFIGVKMLLHHHFEIPNLMSLLVIMVFLGIGMLASVWSNHRERNNKSITP